MIQALKKSLVWVPNLFTLGNLTLGFFSIVMSMKGLENSAALSLAGIFIVVAAFMDGMDGFMARLLNAQSELGAQLDSLADLTTFGIAPGVLMYVLYMDDMAMDLFWKSDVPTGMLLAATYPAFAAFRLARFNVDHSPESFTGLPSPIAGIIIALIPLLISEGFALPAPVAIGIYILVGILMVSTVRYSKPQVTIVRTFSPARLVIGGIVVLAILGFLLYRYGLRVSVMVFFILIMIYVLSGIVALIFHLIQEFRV